MKKEEQNTKNYLSLAERKGELSYTLQNDYLFKIVMESDEKILRALLCSLLHLKEEEIVSVRVMNPILFGSRADDKMTMLDIRMILNNSDIVNIEMQNVDNHDWPERSLIYLCRSFDNLKKGEDYSDVVPAQHAGIIDFPLPDMEAEFYSRFYVMNVRTHEIYSDKLCLSVLNLKYQELATEEDKKWGLDDWAAAFKAGTWEEFQMLAAKNGIYKEISDAVYEALLDNNIREDCRRYEEQKVQQARVVRERDAALKEIQEKDIIIQDAKAEIIEKERRIAELEKALADVKKSK